LYRHDAHLFHAGSVTYNYYFPLDPGKVGLTQWGISPHTDYVRGVKIAPMDTIIGG